MPRGPIGRGGRPEKPKPGSEGATTSKASAGSPPKRSGWASGPMISRNSTTDPGQPWEMMSGVGAGPLPRSWMKWRSMPSTGATNCGKRLRAASCVRQSNSSTQYAQSSFM